MFAAARVGRAASVGYARVVVAHVSKEALGVDEAYRADEGALPLQIFDHVAPPSSVRKRSPAPVP